MHSFILLRSLLSEHYPITRAMKCAVRTPCFPISWSHHCRSLNPFGTWFCYRWTGFFLQRTADPSPILPFPTGYSLFDNLDLIITSTSDCIPSCHCLLMSHQTGVITHYFNSAFKRIPSPPLRHRFRAYYPVPVTITSRSSFLRCAFINSGTSNAFRGLFLVPFGCPWPHLRN